MFNLAEKYCYLILIIELIIPFKKFECIIIITLTNTVVKVKHICDKFKLNGLLWIVSILSFCVCIIMILFVKWN